MYTNAELFQKTKTQHNHSENEYQKLETEKRMHLHKKVLIFDVLIQSKIGKTLIPKVNTCLHCHRRIYRNYRSPKGGTRKFKCKQYKNTLTNFLQVSRFRIIKEFACRRFISSWRHQQSFPCDQWSLCADREHGGPSSDANHGDS